MAARGKRSMTGTAPRTRCWQSGEAQVAVKLAKYLAGKKKNVILLLCDMTAPMLPCICPPGELECEHSLGSVLAAVRVSESLVKHNLVTHKKYGCLTFLGMLKGKMSTPTRRLRPARHRSCSSA